MPVDRGAIDAQLRDIGEGERWWEEREFRDLPYILSADERIHGIVHGRLLRPRRPRIIPSPPGLVVATNQRLICLKREGFGRQQVDLYLGQITGMQHSSRLRTVQITLYTTHRKHRIRVAKADAFRFISALAALLPRPEGAALPAAAANPTLPRPAGLLSRWTQPPAPDPVTRGDLARVEGAVERLEGEVERLRQHVEFLEELLQERSGGTFSLPQSSEGA
jgi:PH (Pleckstrin Homology) domain-containing protein